ncbi:MAG TPA: VOC family protein, partial [Acidimicrobiales bacterium]|nr:VOC family protein [Acidimicrobiales bacterium]
MEVVTSRIIIHPSDIERSLAFYGEVLDLPVVREFGAGPARGVVFAAGGGLIEVVARAPGGSPSDAGGPGLRPSGQSSSMALWLQVRSAGAALADVEARGGVVLRQPVEEPWGLVEAWIEDPDGLRIHLVEVPADHPLRRDQRG